MSNVSLRCRKSNAMQSIRSLVGKRVTSSACAAGRARVGAGRPSCGGRRTTAASGLQLPLLVASGSASARSFRAGGEVHRFVQVRIAWSATGRSSLRVYYPPRFVNRRSGSVPLVGGGLASAYGLYPHRSLASESIHAVPTHIVRPRSSRRLAGLPFLQATASPPLKSNVRPLGIQEFKADVLLLESIATLARAFCPSARSRTFAVTERLPTAAIHPGGESHSLACASRILSSQNS